ncbi:MAG: hypothetical protein GPJ54_09240 [Candidatus Heimdallarchaeota archaeon]|nr:hypothetical protein [Candidatus Heimdallarchaeota archaeon]
MAEDATFSSNETELYLGSAPSEQDQDIIPSFTASGFVPLGWFFFFKPDDILNRESVNPKSWQGLISEDTNFTEVGADSVDQYMKEPIMLKTTLPEAKARLTEFKEAFQSLPYIWSYFRIIGILDNQLEKIITELEENFVVTPVRKVTPEFDKPRSQVKVKAEKSSTQKIEAKPVSADLDNPFAELEDFGLDTKPDAGDDDILLGLDSDLISALEAATEFDRMQEEIKVEQQFEDDLEDPNVLPIIINFDKISGKSNGYRIGKVPVILERLLHHAKREGKMTRIMQDYLQDIFRELSIDWRITGLLAEDFVQSDPSTLSYQLIGSPSPFVIIRESFDLRYWTTEALQSGDERLMYTLAMLPSEEIHRAIRDGRLNEMQDRIGNILITTQSYNPPMLSLDNLKKQPVNSNIWGFRVLIQDISGEYKAATILCNDPNKSWEDDFKAKVNLPGVLIDWNVEYLARFSDFSDSDNYRVVLKKAKDIEFTFQAFVRWVRRHNILYRNKYGVTGTISYLKQIIIDTEDKELGKLVFDILTNLTEFGISQATEVLSDDAIVRKLPWLYSDA